MSRKASEAIPVQLKHVAPRLIVVALVISGVIATASLLISCKGGTPMRPTEPAAHRRPGLPPIDVSAPTKTKTATFAMG